MLFSNCARGLPRKPLFFFGPILFALSLCAFPQSSSAQVANAAQEIPRDVIRVWKAGSPYRGDIPDSRIPPELSRKAESLGCRIEVRSVPARDLSGLMANAFATNDEPDILVIDNMGLILGITTQLGRFDGIAKDPRVRSSLVNVSEAFRPLESTRGWEYLLKTSRSFAKARQLAMMEPECNAAFGKSGPWIADSKTDLEKTAATAATGYFSRDLSTLDALTGASYLSDSELLRQPQSVVSSVKVCGGWGNQRLAFINTMTRFESSQTVGYGNLLEVLTNTEGQWKLISLSTDSRIIATLQQNGIVLKDAGDAHSALEPPMLISPADGALFNRWPAEERPMLEWARASRSTVVYLVEAQFTNPPRRGQTETLWASNGFTMAPSTSVNGLTLSITIRASFGIGQQPHRWRVWAIDENGFTARSEWRVVNYVN